MIPMNQAIEYLSQAYPEDTTIITLAEAPFCCFGFLEALYNSEIVKNKETGYRLRADGYDDEYRIKYCPFCGSQVSGEPL